MNIINFTPRAGATVGIAVTTTSGSTAKKICSDGEIDLLIYNPGSTDISLEIGGNASLTCAAATTSLNGAMLVPAGTLQVMRGMRGSADGVYAAAVMGSGTGTIFITPGNGS